MIVPELLKQGNIDALTALSQSVGTMFDSSRKSRVEIYSKHVTRIQENIERLFKLNNDLQKEGVENPQALLAQIAEEIQESIRVLATTTNAPEKRKIILDNMFAVMNALNQAQSELVRAPLRTQFAQTAEATKNDYKQGKNGYYDTYVTREWPNYSASYDKKFVQHVACGARKRI